MVGGELAVARRTGSLEDPVLVNPSVNAIAPFAGERLHWVRPLYAGERLSVVVNLY